MNLRMEAGHQIRRPVFGFRFKPVFSLIDHLNVMTVAVFNQLLQSPVIVEMLEWDLLGD